MIAGASNESSTSILKGVVLATCTALLGMAAVREPVLLQHFNVKDPQIDIWPETI